MNKKGKYSGTKPKRKRTRRKSLGKEEEVKDRRGTK